MLNNKLLKPSLLIICLISFCFFKGISQPRYFKWQALRGNEVSISGWLKIQAQEDLRNGLPGKLDIINNDITHNIFASQSALLKQKGTPSWWPGEQEGYWYEGLINLAFLSGDKNTIDRAKNWVNKILKSQGADGYIGVYAPKERLKPVADADLGELGAELHTQAHCLLALIAYYQHTGDEKILNAIEKAANVTMKAYGAGVFGRSTIANDKKGGVSHAVTFADPMIQLYSITGKPEYLKFVAHMYKDYNDFSPRDHDLARSVLDSDTSVFNGHGAHTAESFHMVQAAALLNTNGLKNYPAIALEKLSRHLTPGGALVSGEMIDGKLGNGSNLYEHCTQNELLKSYGFLLEYTGSNEIAASAERLYYNSMQGARLHPLLAVQYLSRDDRLDIPTNAAKVATNIRNEGSHFQMSSIIRPTCCSASTGRALPYFIATTWMKSPDGDKLAIMNFAPSEVKTKVGGKEIKICEVTNYPFDDKLALKISASAKVKFDLYIRMPLEGEIKAEGVAAKEIAYRDGFMVISRTWSDKDEINLHINMPVVIEQTADKKASYLRRGGLVYGIPFKTEVTAVAENPDINGNKSSGLFEYDIRVKDKSNWGLRIDADAKFKIKNLKGDCSHPWNGSPIGISGNMIDQNGNPVAVTLVPEGTSLSRRITFLDKSKSASAAAQLPLVERVGIGY